VCAHRATSELSHEGALALSRLAPDEDDLPMPRQGPIQKPVEAGKLRYATYERIWRPAHGGGNSLNERRHERLGVYFQSLGGHNRWERAATDRFSHQLF
jgi:hypothetical protein